MATKLAMRHGMDIGLAREFIGTVRGPIELMHADMADPPSLAKAVDTHTDPHPLIDSDRRSGA